MTRQKTAVLEYSKIKSNPAACHCLCSARHPNKKGVCTGSLLCGGFAVLLNSVYSTGKPLKICKACGDAWPEIDSEMTRDLVSIVGRTIVSASIESDEFAGLTFDKVVLVLDDGRTVTFSGVGDVNAEVEVNISD